MTSLGFSVRFLRRRTQPLQELLGWPKAYQKQVIQALPPERVPELFEFLVGLGQSLAPDIWVLGIERVARHEDHSVIFDRIFTLIQSADELSKPARLKALSYLAESLEARVALEKIVENPESWRLKDMALNVRATLHSQ